ncbi:MAG: hypothetical protein RML92_09470, partial [Bacteroidia bacterium]|nr:hypothetical protein [Bacteroidia bacterium]
MGSANIQATHRSEILTANPATAFPSARWSAQASIALLAPAPELSFRVGGVAFTPDSIQAFSLLLQQWNFDKLSQWEAGGSYLLHLFQHKVLVAVRGRVLATDFSEYGRLFRFTPDIGL